MTRNRRTRLLKVSLFGVPAALLLSSATQAFGQSTAFTYQGRLRDNGVPVDGQYDFQFDVFDAAAGGAPVAPTVVLDGAAGPVVTVTGGLFTATLDFGPGVFGSADRWLEISSRPNGVGGYQMLTPRQKITPAPCAIAAQTAASAQTASTATALQLPYAGTANVGAGSAVLKGTSTGAGAGVRGDSTSGPGVQGTSSTNYGVRGDSTSFPGVAGVSSSNYGVQGVSTDSIGAYGQSTNNIGVLGQTSNAASFAGYFSGKVHVNGTLSKNGGSFKIDHPLDPANKYLSHSFVESPDMKNIYDGVATLDANGEARVTLPDWFEALNRDFRYQLTCIGAFAPVFIKQEVHDGRFLISGGRGGQRVSWQVTGIRQDNWANAHRIPVEEDKPAIERGKFLTPVEHGRPKELLIGPALPAVESSSFPLTTISPEPALSMDTR